MPPKDTTSRQIKEICPLSLPYTNRLVTSNVKGINFDGAFFFCPGPSSFEYTGGFLMSLHILGNHHVTETGKVKSRSRKSTISPSAEVERLEAGVQRGNNSVRIYKSLCPFFSHRKLVTVQPLSPDNSWLHVEVIETSRTILSRLGDQIMRSIEWANGPGNSWLTIHVPVVSSVSASLHFLLV